MPESHWIVLAIERIEKLLMDSIVGIYLDKTVKEELWDERSRLITRCSATLASEQLLARQFETHQFAQ
jgi:hypothetical protein